VQVERLRINQQTTASLQLACLGRLAPEEVQARLGIEPAVLAAWQALDFDIADLEGALGWLMDHVVAPERDPGHAQRLRFVLALGPSGARAVLDQQSGLPVDEADRLAQQQVALHFKMRDALDVPGQTPAQAERFIALFLRTRQREAELELRREELIQKCKSAAQDRELALRQVDLEIALVQARAAEATRQDTLLQVQLAQLRHGASAAAVLSRPPASSPPPAAQCAAMAASAVPPVTKRKRAKGTGMEKKPPVTPQRAQGAA
jgi:hypothetical protein